MRDTLPLSDRLAIERTGLAIHRTWLSISRTALALFVTGASFLKFFDEPVWQGVGIVAMVSAFPTAGWGWWQFTQRLKRLGEHARAAEVDAQDG